MSTITIILIIAFFVILLFKPSYMMGRAETEEGVSFCFFTCAPLYFILLAKILCWSDTLILTAKEYDEAIEIYNSMSDEEKEAQLKIIEGER